MSAGIVQKVGLTKIIIGIVVVATAATLLITKPFSSFKTNNSVETIDPGFGNYISTFTSGVISIKSNIKITFTKDVVDSFLQESEVEASLLSFSPSIAGTAYWVSANTIEFRPQQDFPYGKEYKAELNLKDIIDNVESDFETFEFSFKTLDLNIELTIDGISYEEVNGKQNQVVTGKMNCSDVIDTVEIAKMFNASQNGEKLQIAWKHNENGREHAFVIKNVRREVEKSIVKISYEYSANGSDVEGQNEVEIPGKGDFVFTNGKVVHSPDQYVSVRFSDLLDERQNLNGLIQMGSLDFNYEVEGNEIKLYPTTRQVGSVDVRINKSIKNAEGKSLESDFTFNATFEQIKPDVRWSDEGNIIPTSNGIYLSFEAVALKAVDVEVIKIYENNVKQFFQNNEINGNEELKRVGRPVLRKTISLEESGVANILKWNKYNLDLNELSEAEPGAIYNVHISYRMQHAAYVCGEADSLTEQKWNEGDYDNPNSYYSYRYNYYYSGYNYRERENPCHISYYINHGHGITKNVLSTDIGVIAKKGKSNQLNFAVTSLTTSKPLANTEIKIFNLQQQEITNLNTDNEGFASVELNEIPYIAELSYNGEKNYLRLDNSTNLSLSHFNTSGVSTQNGFKGFIYGERGVWRPGDSVFISFVLEDKEKLLPSGHPIVLELEDPRGKIRAREVKTSYPDHLYAFKVKTDIDAPTGMWLARVSVGDNSFTKSIPIETIKPNRLKINVDFDKDAVTASDPYLRGTLSAKWLHGAIAKNMDAKIEANLFPVTTTFENYEGYDFDDDARSFTSESKEIFSGKLNDKGSAVVAANLKPNSFAPGKVIAKLKTTVTEHSGNTSIDMFEVPYYPYDNFVGVKMPQGRYGWLQTDTSHNLQLALVDHYGKPISGTRNVTVELYKLDFRWWWDRSSDYLSNYVYSSYRKPVIKGSAQITNGKGNYSLKVERPNWGRYYLKVTDPVSGHSTGRTVYISWPYWAGKSNEQAGISVLDFKSDKEDYNVGDVADIKIPSTPQGRALVSVENGIKVLKQFWVETEKGNANFKLEITEEMAPNVYVHVSQIQPHGNADNDLPIRLYGIININVKNEKSILIPEIEMPEVLRPDEEFEVTIEEKNGSEMVYTLAIVDEGLLDLTRFKTPQPWDHFYAKEALGVSSFDMYKYVTGSNSGELSNVLGIGGDMANNGSEDSKLNRFEPCVMYLGPFKLKKNGKQTHKIKMPYYVGSVRTMVVARQNSAYGNTENTTPVRKPLMVLGTAPRVLSPNEEVLIPASVFAMEENIKSADVSIEVNDLFEVVGPAKLKINFKEIGEEMAYFKLKVKAKVGVGSIKILANSGKESAIDDIKLLVRAPNPPVTNLYKSLLTANGNETIEFNNIGIDGTNSASLEVSAIPPLNVEKNLKYLIGYPHGCIEQTTSKSFAQMLLPDIVELSEKDKAEIVKNVKAGISRVLGMQTSDGGFGYWPGDLLSNEWGSNYAGHFLIEAQKRGYDVPKSALKSWSKFQSRLSDEYSPSTERYYRYNYGLNQSYRLYTLALYGSPNVGAMNRLRNTEKLSVTSVWRLASAYAKAGQLDVSNKLVDGIPQRVEKYTELSNTYGSNLRDMAMILETLVDMNDLLNATMVLKEVSDIMNESRWWGTHTTAYCMLAASKYANINKSRENINFDYSFGNLDSRNASTGMQIARIKLSDTEMKTGNVTLKNKTGSIYYVQMVTVGRPLQGDSVNSSNDLNMSIRYTDMSGAALDISSLQQGASFKAEISISNPGRRGYYEEMALTQMIPSGWEIVNTRFEGTEAAYKSSTYEYRDIRDDKVLTYFDIGTNQTLNYTILLNANYAGKFYLPAITCNAMYDNTINASLAGKWIYVVSENFN